MYIAELYTGKWDLRAFGESEDQAIKNMEKLYKTNAYNYGFSYNWNFVSDAVRVYQVGSPVIF